MVATQRPVRRSGTAAADRPYRGGARRAGPASAVFEHRLRTAGPGHRGDHRDELRRGGHRAGALPGRGGRDRPRPADGGYGAGGGRRLRARTHLAAARAATGGGADQHRRARRGDRLLGDRRGDRERRRTGADVRCAAGAEIASGNATSGVDTPRRRAVRAGAAAGSAARLHGDRSLRRVPDGALPHLGGPGGAAGRERDRHLGGLPQLGYRRRHPRAAVPRCGPSRTAGAGVGARWGSGRRLRRQAPSPYARGAG